MCEVFTLSNLQVVLVLEQEEVDPESRDNSG